MTIQSAGNLFLLSKVMVGGDPGPANQAAPPAACNGAASAKSLLGKGAAFWRAENCSSQIAATLPHLPHRLKWISPAHIFLAERMPFIQELLSSWESEDLNAHLLHLFVDTAWFPLRTFNGFFSLVLKP